MVPHVHLTFLYIYLNYKFIIQIDILLIIQLCLLCVDCVKKNGQLRLI